MVNKEKYISTAELADFLSVTRQAVYKWRKQGAPHIQMGDRTIRYNAQDVIDWRIAYVKNPRNGADGNGKR